MKHVLCKCSLFQWLFFSDLIIEHRAFIYTYRGALMNRIMIFAGHFQIFRILWFSFLYASGTSNTAQKHM